MISCQQSQIGLLDLNGLFDFLRLLFFIGELSPLVVDGLLNFTGFAQVELEQILLFFDGPLRLVHIRLPLDQFHAHRPNVSEGLSVFLDVLLRQLEGLSLRKMAFDREFSAADLAPLASLRIEELNQNDI